MFHVKPYPMIPERKTPGLAVLAHGKSSGYSQSASLLAHERSRFAICQWKLSISTGINIPFARHLVLCALEAWECLSTFNQGVYIYAWIWSGCLLQFLWDSRLLNRFIVHCLQKLKSSPLDIISKYILFLFCTLVLILSIYLFLSMFILVFCQFIDFPLFYYLDASLCCLFPVLRTFHDWIHVFPIIATRAHQVNRIFAIHPAVLLTRPSFAICSCTQSLLDLPLGAFNRHWHKQ